MDKKTMEKVINGMAEKLEKYIDNTNKELKTLGIYKDDRCDNYPVIESLIKLNKKVDSLEDDIKTLTDRHLKCDIRIYNLENKVKYNESFNHDEDKIEALEDDIKALNNKVSGLQWDTAQDTNKLDEKCNEIYDDLEAKNYQIKSDLDNLINGDETITFRELRKLKKWDDLDDEFLDLIREGAKTIKRVKANKLTDDINDLEVKQGEEQDIYADENEDKLISDNPVEFPTIAQNPKYKRKGVK